MVRKFSPSDEVFGCLVTRETLDQLVEFATIGDGGDLKGPSISSKRGDSEFSAESLEELLSELGEKKPVRNIRMYCHHWDLGRKVSISIQPFVASVSVEGDDEIWVGGQLKAIVSRLKESKRRGLVFGPLGSVITMGAALTLSAVLAIVSTAHRSYLVSLLSLLGSFVMTGLLGVYLYRRSRCEIYAFGDKPAKATFGFDRINGLIGTVITALILYYTWLIYIKAH